MATPRSTAPVEPARAERDAGAPGRRRRSGNGHAEARALHDGHGNGAAHGDVEVPAAGLERASVAPRSLRETVGAVETRRLHLVVFEDAHETVEAVRRLRADGFTIEEVYSPFPVHGLDEAMGLEETRLPWATFLGGGIGLTIAFSLQSFTSTVSWPLNIGGKTNLALPALIPVGFELTVLLAAFATVGTLIFRERLFGRRKEDKKGYVLDPRITDDRFVIVVAESSGAFSPDRFRALCKELCPAETVESWRVQ